MSTTNFDNTHGVRIAQGIVGTSIAGSGQIIVTDGTTEVDAYQITIDGGTVSEPADGIAEIGIGGNTRNYTNASGVDLDHGDVVVIDSSGQITTTTTAQDTRVVGVVQAPITNGSSGPIIFAGYVDLVNVTASVTAGRYLETSTTAKQATENTTRRTGSFGYILTSGTSPTAILFGVPDTTASGGGSGSGVPWFNVKNYGAVGDGATDDTAAIQAAVTACSAAGGGIVYVPPGHYLLSTTTSGARYAITLSSNVMLLGDGYASYLELTNAGNASTVQAVIELATASTSASHITIRRLRIEANHSTLGVGKSIQGIHARQDSDMTQHVDDVLIEDCDIEDVNVGVVCSKDGNSSGSARTANRHLRWMVRGNRIATSANKAVELQECLVGAIIDNIARSATDGYQTVNYSERIEIGRNFAEYKNAGISVTEGCLDVDVHHNFLVAVAGGGGSIGAAGIILRREPYTGAITAYRIRVTDNFVYDAVSSTQYLFAFETRTENTGVSVWEDVLIARNFFRGSGNSYLYDKASATRSSATGLRVFDNFFGGPALTHASWSSSGTLVDRNRFNAAHTANSTGWNYGLLNTFVVSLTVSGSSIVFGPLQAAGDLIIGGTGAAPSRLAVGGANTVLHGGASAPAYSAVLPADLDVTADNTTANATSGHHGFLPKLSNVATEYLDGTGAWSTPAGSSQHILLADSHATPFTFNDLLQMDDGSDFMWTDPE